MVSLVDADVKRDILRRTILEQLRKGSVHYTDLDKKVCATCYPFATTNTFKSQFQYLLNNGYVERIYRGIYKITSKGEKYLMLLIS
jgi:predicted transcriptional regulator